MYFSSMTFLWIFLPATLLLYLLAERFQRIALENFVLLSASLIFYAWGEPFYIFLLLFSVLMNYVFGRLLEAERPRFRKWILACGVLSNLGLLAFFKYFNFFAVTSTVFWGRMQFRLVSLRCRLEFHFIRFRRCLMSLTFTAKR